MRVLIPLAALVALPCGALARMSAQVDWRILAGIPLALSLAAYAACLCDKRRSEAGKWRIPETTLHIAELLGGWPGSFLAQRLHRHKTSKVRYQFTFWAIILFHQLLALDAWLGWPVVGQVVKLVASRVP